MQDEDPVQDDEPGLFEQEMQGVVPIKQQTVIDQPRRDGPTENQLKNRIAATQANEQDENILSVEYVDMLDPYDVIFFKRDGVQEGVYRKLRLGKYEIDAVLDLHRKTIKEAREEVFDFVRDCVDSGLRTVMILHGKGERSKPPAVLKSYVAKWLPDLHHVLAYHSAQQYHGGAGALYVLLRKSDRKKQENRERHMKGRVI